MSAEPRIFIYGAGAQCAAGRAPAAAAAASRCGLSASAEHPYMVDRHGEPFVVARADWLDDALDRVGRVSRLAQDAARPALAAAPREAWRKGAVWGLALATPEGPGMAQQLAAELQATRA